MMPYRCECIACGRRYRATLSRLRDAAREKVGVGSGTHGGPRSYRVRSWLRRVPEVRSLHLSGGGRDNVNVLYRIELPYACGGILVENGIVKTTAPIFKWMRGKSVESIREWMSTKRGTIRRAAHTEEPPRLTGLDF